MISNLKDNKKRITAIVIAAVLAIAAVAGIAAGVRATTSSTVPVVPVSQLNYGEYLDWQNSITGIITTDAEQAIYLSDTEKVEEVVVEEGQSVHKGDVLLRYDISSTKLNLEKEKINRERIELSIDVAKQNIKTLENTSPVSDSDEIGFMEDFEELAMEETLKKAKVHKKELKADAKPVEDDPEDTMLGTEEYPYTFLCEGDSVIITKEFIAKWQKLAKKRKVKQLYIALQTRDKAMHLQKAWITDIMLLNSKYDVEVDLTTGETSYAKINDPAEMAKLLRKVLRNVPEDERGAWLAVMMDKLLITTEKEEKKKERGELLAEMLSELNREDQEEFSEAAARMDEKAISSVFKSLSENLTEEDVARIDADAVAGILTLLLKNMSKEQIRAMDADLLASFLNNLSTEQLSVLGTDQVAEILIGMDEDQLREVMNKLLDAREEEVSQILQDYKDEHKQESGGNEGQESGGNEGGQTGGNEGQETGGNEGQETGGNEGQETGGNEGGQTGAGEEQQPGESAGQGGAAEAGSGSSAGETVPSTSPSPTESDGDDGQLLTEDMTYTSDELAVAKREAREKLRDLELDMKESDIKIKKAQKALDEGVVRANMNGVVKNVGDPDSPPTDGSPFLTVAGSEGLFVRSGVKESRLGSVKEGDMVTVTSWQTGGRYDAEIKSISPYPDTTGMFDDEQTETYFPFTASVLDENAVLENGDWVEVSYSSNSSGESSEGAMTIMKAFVREEGTKKYVYVRDENNRLKKQYIITGTLSDSGYEVIDGITESDWVAFPYGKSVKEGARTREGTLDELYE